MTGTPDAAAVALRRLHHAIRGLPVSSYWWQIKSALPGVPDKVLASASDPDAQELLEPAVYIGIARACGSTVEQLRNIALLYGAAKTARDGAPQEERADPFDDYRPWIPHLSDTPEGSRDHRLDNIRTRTEFMDYLKFRVTQSRLSYRTIEEQTRALDSRHTMPRSTLSDALNHRIVPTDEDVLRTLLKVLLRPIAPDNPDELDDRIEEILTVWRRVLRDDLPLIPSPESTPGTDAVVRAIMRDIARAETTAIIQGDIAFIGLAQAQQLIRRDYL